jgi:DNA-directed RNA polymerase specialized sigma24 family protein
MRPLTEKLRRYFEQNFDDADAKDLAQHSVAIVFVQLPGFRPDESLMAWVIGIAHKLALNEFRARSRRIRIEDAMREVQLLPGPSPSSDLECLERLRLAQSELPSLPDHLRSVIDHDLADGEPEAFANKEGIAQATIRSRRHRAHKLLGERVRQRSKTPPERVTPTPAS